MLWHSSLTRGRVIAVVVFGGGLYNWVMTSKRRKAGNANRAISSGLWQHTAEVFLRFFMQIGDFDARCECGVVGV